MSFDNHIPFEKFGSDSHYKAVQGKYRISWTAPLEGTYVVGEKSVYLKKGESAEFMVDESELNDKVMIYAPR